MPTEPDYRTAAIRGQQIHDRAYALMTERRNAYFAEPDEKQRQPLPSWADCLAGATAEIDARAPAAPPAPKPAAPKPAAPAPAPVAG